MAAPSRRGLHGAPSRPGHARNLPRDFPGLLLPSALVLALVLALQPSSGVELASSETRIGILRGSESNLDLSRVIQLSQSPKVFLYDGFLSAAECDYLTLVARGKLDPPNKKPLGNSMFIRKYQDAMVRKIEDRITGWVLPPRATPDAIKVMRYNTNQTFDVHYEFYSNPSGDRRKGTRAATVLLFLSDVESGGEIVFPRATMDEATTAAQRAMNANNPCALQGLAVKPRKGSALLFFNMLPNGERDAASGFVECQVAAGERWVASKSISVQRYSTRRDPNACTDEHEQCPTWARAGECERNPKFMVGAAGYMGNCRKSCKVCTPKKA